MRALLVLVALLAAGCTGAPESLAHLATVEESVAEIVRLPATNGELPPEPADAEPCARLDASVENARIAPGQLATVHARLTNCGDAPLDRRTGCTHAWSATLPVEGETYHLATGTAFQGMLCATAIGSWHLMPGASMDATWSWDGTLERCDDAGCQRVPAPQGEHTIEIQVEGSRVDWDRSVQSAWTRTVVIVVTHDEPGDRR